MKLWTEKHPYNRIIFLISLVIVSSLTVISFFGQFAYEEGTGGEISEILSYFFMVLRFPTHTLFWNLELPIPFLFPILFFLGLIINMIFYSILIERIIAYLKK